MMSRCFIATRWSAAAERRFWLCAIQSRKLRQVAALQGVARFLAALLLTYKATPQPLRGETLPVVRSTIPQCLWVSHLA